MSTTTLAVALDADVRALVGPLFARHEMDVRPVTLAREAVAVASEQRVDLVACSYPLPDMVLRDFGEAIRRGDSASRAAALLVLTLPEMRAEARRGLPRGRALVASRTARSAALHETIAQLLRVAPRREGRMSSHLQVSLNEHISRISASVVNISTSGMLVDCPTPPPASSSCSFEVELGRGDEPVRGEAEVVRHTNPSCEQVRGFAVRFTALDDEARQRLQVHVDEG
jgi:CheY-like chemotaxis protein